MEEIELTKEPVTKQKKTLSEAQLKNLEKMRQNKLIKKKANELIKNEKIKTQNQPQPQTPTETHRDTQNEQQIKNNFDEQLLVAQQTTKLFVDDLKNDINYIKSYIDDKKRKKQEKQEEIEKQEEQPTQYYERKLIHSIIRK